MPTPDRGTDEHKARSLGQGPFGGVSNDAIKKKIDNIEEDAKHNKKQMRALEMLLDLTTDKSRRDVYIKDLSDRAKKEHALYTERRALSSKHAAPVPRATRELEEQLEAIFLAHVITAVLSPRGELRRRIRDTTRTGNVDILMDFATKDYFADPLSLFVMRGELADAMRKAK